jgi:hypothetical protein
MLAYNNPATARAAYARALETNTPPVQISAVVR